MEFAKWWTAYTETAAREQKLPADTPLPTVEDIASALREPWMTAARETAMDRMMTWEHTRRRLTMRQQEQEDKFSPTGVQTKLQLSKEAEANLFSLYMILRPPDPYLEGLVAGSPESTMSFFNQSLKILHEMWGSVPVDLRKAAGFKHPLAPLIEGWMQEQQRKREKPARARVLTAGRAKLGRVPNGAKTAVLATWQELPEAVVVEVDGEPVTSQLHLTPSRARGRKEDDMQLMLPGTAQAVDLRLALIKEIEAQPGIDRRNPLPADTLYLLALGSAVARPVTMHADQLGAMMAGRFDADGIEPRTRRLWRSRAWAAIQWASMSVTTPHGHWLPLLAIDYGRNLPEGYVRVWPYNWGEHGKGYRLTGVLTQQAARHSRSGSVERLAAGIEDHIAGSGRLGRDPRPRLLIPERAGGPGPQSEFIPYPVLLARAGFHFDLTDAKSAGATRELWRRLSGELKDRNYVISKLSAQAEAGDTFEIVELRTGSRGGYGGIIVRASDRWIEAQAAISRKRGDKGLDVVPLPRLFD